MAILAGIIPSSCSSARNPTAQQHAQVVTVATSSESLTNKNLGELQLTNHYETCVNLGAGKSCTIKPSLFNHTELRLTVALESKNANGVTKGLSIIQIITKSGQPFEVAVGDMNITLTPILTE